MISNLKERQHKNKCYYDRVHRVKSQEMKKGDWVVLQKSVKPQKGLSRYTQPLKVLDVTGSSVLVKGKGWWNKSAVIVLRKEQESILNNMNKYRQNEEVDCFFHKYGEENSKSIGKKQTLICDTSLETQIDSGEVNIEEVRTTADPSDTSQNNQGTDFQRDQYRGSKQNC